jgi:hypothetical protein
MVAIQSSFAGESVYSDLNGKEPPAPHIGSSSPLKREVMGKTAAVKTGASGQHRAIEGYEPSDRPTRKSSETHAPHEHVFEPF